VTLCGNECPLPGSLTWSCPRNQVSRNWDLRREDLYFVVPAKAGTQGFQTLALSPHLRTKACTHPAQEPGDKSPLRPSGGEGGTSPSLPSPARGGGFGWGREGEVGGERSGTLFRRSRESVAKAGTQGFQSLALDPRSRTKSCIHPARNRQQIPSPTFRGKGGTYPLLPSPARGRAVRGKSRYNFSAFRRC
jgi:hypothetical protein